MTPPAEFGTGFEALVRELVADEVARQFESRADREGSAGSPWLGIERAAEYLGVSVRTLERRITSGRVRSTTIGRRRLLHCSDLDALADQATTGEDVAPTTPPRRHLSE